MSALLEGPVICTTALVGAPYGHVVTLLMILLSQLF